MLNEELLATDPWWMRDCIIRGYEGEPAGDPAGDAGDGAEGDGEGEEDSDDDSNSEDPDDASGDGNRDDKGLKSALAKERAANKKAQRELRALQKDKADRDAATGSELEQARKKAEAAEAREKALATKLVNQAVESAIEREARKLKFRVPEDALLMIKRADIVVDQDKTDPSDIEVDVKSVQKAVKALADRRKDLLGTDGENQDPSGSRFNGAGGDKKKATEDELRAKYRI